MIVKNITSDLRDTLRADFPSYSAKAVYVAKPPKPTSQVSWARGYSHSPSQSTSFMDTTSSLPP